MLTSIEINGQYYHAQYTDYDEATDEYNRIEPILEEDGSLIPIHICLCHAYEPGECCCSTTAWDNYRYDDDDDEY